MSTFCQELPMVLSNLTAIAFLTSLYPGVYALSRRIEEMTSILYLLQWIRFSLRMESHYEWLSVGISIVLLNSLEP